MKLFWGIVHGNPSSKLAGIDEHVCDFGCQACGGVQTYLGGVERQELRVKALSLEQVLPHEVAICRLQMPKKQSLKRHQSTADAGMPCCCHNLQCVLATAGCAEVPQLRHRHKQQHGASLGCV